MSEKKFEKVLEQFGALPLEEKAKFLLKATFETAFGAFEELSNLMAETYQAVSSERRNDADEKFKATEKEAPQGFDVPISDEMVNESPNFEVVETPESPSKEVPESPSKEAPEEAK